MRWGLSGAPILMVTHRESPTSPCLSAPMGRRGTAYGERRSAMLALEPLGQALALLRHVEQQFLDRGSLGADREVAQSPRLLAQYF